MYFICIYRFSSFTSQIALSYVIISPIKKKKRVNKEKRKKERRKRKWVRFVLFFRKYVFFIWKNTIC